jgi:SP family arabinose:H+ symporter-like MFS transporter
MAMTSYLLKSSIVGALGGLLFGFDTAVTHAGALVWLLVAYIAFFSVSQGAVIWVSLAHDMSGSGSN